MQVKDYTPSLNKGESQQDNISEDHLFDSLTNHAWDRMHERGISNEAVFQTIAFGRISRGRGATIYAIGKKEVLKYSKKGIDLTSYEGVHVVMTRVGTISTVYRNLDMPKVKPRKKIPERIFRQNLRRQNTGQCLQQFAFA